MVGRICPNWVAERLASSLSPAQTVRMREEYFCDLLEAFVSPQTFHSNWHPLSSLMAQWVREPVWLVQALAGELPSASVQPKKKKNTTAYVRSLDSRKPLEGPG